MKKSINDLDLKGKKVLIRADFNVPLDASSNITDDTRIQESLATIRLALEKGASRVVMMSHLGRPKGKDAKLSLKPVSKRLAELLKEEVVQCSDCIGSAAQGELQAGKRLYLLENLRWYAEEEKNDAGFAKSLSAFGEVYVNDAFGTSHRAHASVEGITHFLPAVAGLLLEKEIKYLGEALKSPKRPFVAILGGAKVSDKIGVIENLLRKVDKIIIGGAMAYTFMKVKGLPIGKSRFEAERLGLAEEILKKAAIEKIEVLLPVDNIAVQEVSDAAPFKVVENGIPDGWEGVDIGPKTIKNFAAAIAQAKTIVWNGPMGIFEMKNFKNGSIAVAKAMADNHGAVTIVGGGDSAAAVAQFGLSDRMTHISTGGGASLEYLEGKPLPGIEALQDKTDTTSFPRKRESGSPLARG